ncbi:MULTISPECIES: septum site-determining protein MinC [unclassified Pigmentiphaga]|uniref:septum site-determining protein MinC n=1 Tax=unclassified Pigmentiphaga TaxID=2626614 RepID=UPI000B419BBF|nr:MULTISPECIES: septum site-determining protein MinC [unclassified Pigmentiphaga]OVZ65952.1 septum site-determining protein MinC [Pigmentiphaga sp. NML030171]
MEASPVLDIKSTSLYAIRVVLHSSDLQAVLAALDQRMEEAAGFFEDEPVVIDASRLTEPLDWNQLAEALKRHGLPTIGIMAPADLAESARQAGLALLSLPAAPARSPAPEPEAAAEPEPAPAAQAPAPAPSQPETPPATETVAEQPPAAPHAVPTMVIDKPLRSGQRVYARHADLIVMGVVSHGAEVIADGNIHVYGPLRGKAMAGARGDTKARIYTTRLEAELVAVAGVYRTLTTALSPDIQDKPALIRLDGEKLLVEPLPI